MKYNSQMEMLLRMFPEIPEDKAINLDRCLKDKISSQTNQNLLNELTDELVKELLPSIKTKNRKNAKKKCKKVVAFYMNNEHQFVLRENWFCFLAYLISLFAMGVRILNLSTDCNDILSLIMYFGALLIWLVLVKAKYAMGDEAKLWLDSFNRCAPSMTIIWSLLFYCAICSKIVPIWGLIMIVLASLISTGYLTVYKYKSGIPST